MCCTGFLHRPYGNLFCEQLAFSSLDKIFYTNGVSGWSGALDTCDIGDTLIQYGYSERSTIENGLFSTTFERARLVEHVNGEST